MRQLTATDGNTRKAVLRARMNDAVPEHLWEGVAENPVRGARDLPTEYTFRFVSELKVPELLAEAAHIAHLSKLDVKGPARYRLLSYRDAYGETGKRLLQVSGVAGHWQDVAFLYEGGDAKVLQEELSAEKTNILLFESKKNFILSEGTAPSVDVWNMMRSVMREVIHTERRPKAENIERDAEVGITKMAQELQGVLEQPPTDYDIKTAFALVKEEVDAVRLREGFVEIAQEIAQGVTGSYGEYIWFSMKSAWYLFDAMIKARPMPVAVGETTIYIKTWMVATFLGVAGYVSGLIGTVAIKSAVSKFFGGLGRILAYRKVAWSAIPNTENWPLSHLEIGGEYYFVEEVPTAGLDKLKAQPVLVRQRIPFTFLGYVIPWAKLWRRPVLLIEPLAGILKGEKRVADLENISKIHHLLSGQKLGVAE